MSSAKCDWPLGRSHVVLESDFAVVFFDNIQTKCRLYNDFLKQFTQNDQENSILGFEIADSKGPKTLDVFVIECGLRSLNKLTKYYTGLHLFQCNDSSLLLEILQLIIDCSLDRLDNCRLNTLIVENLSSFYWEKRCQDRLSRIQWYKDVNEKLRELKCKYMCNVVITMWDLEFERGYKSKPSQDTSALSKALSYTPNELFLGCLYTIRYRDGDVYQYLNGAWLLVK